MKRLKKLDFLFVMAYDTRYHKYHYWFRSQIFGQCIAQANAPLVTVSNGILQFTNLIQASKLVLGMPWYGYNYPCLGFDPKQPELCFIPHVPFRGVNCSDAAGSQWDYRLIRNLLDNGSTLTGRQWNEDLKSPWFNFSPDGQSIHQMWYDDSEVYFTMRPIQ